MGKGNIERKTKREKRDFRLGGTQEERESKVLLPSRRHREYVQEQRKRKPHKKEKEKRVAKKELLSYEARVRFETRVRVRVRVRDSAIFKKGGCGCGGTQQLKNY